MRITWEDEIVQAYQALGGSATYSELYNYIEKNTSRSLTNEWKATVRREVENHSSDSNNYRQGCEDLFYSVNGLGHGYWGLRNALPKTKQAIDLQDPTSNMSNSGTFNLNGGSALPERGDIEVSRIIRDTFIVKQLKLLYKNRCQICGNTCRLKNRDYSEGHHLQPLGGKHKGPDVTANIIILCPNHHVEFDYGAIAIEPSTLQIVHLDPQNQFIGKKLILQKIHKLDQPYLNYHFSQVFNI